MFVYLVKDKVWPQPIIRKRIAHNLLNMVVYNHLSIVTHVTYVIFLLLVVALFVVKLCCSLYSHIMNLFFFFSILCILIFFFSSLLAS